MYKQEDFLQLSGLQHFKFCRRQWALIHIENIWADNFATADGMIFHERAHDGNFSETRGEIIITRNMPVHSPRLGVSGTCDVVEFHKNSKGIPLENRAGLWLPFPVEYKRGGPKPDSRDALQLCGQGMCLEYMLCCDIPAGALYYGQTRHRQEVKFTPELRRETEDLILEMHDLYNRGHTPKVRPKKVCGACSLKDMCLPKLMRNVTVSEYVKRALEESE